MIAALVVLRPTQKVLRSLPLTGAAGATSDTALGDWYINRVVIDRQPLLLMISSRSLLAIVTPARELKKLPLRLPSLIDERLKRLPINAHVRQCEVEATRSFAVAKTTDRSVLGQLVDFAKSLTFYIPEGLWGEADLRNAEDRFGETPCRCSGSYSDTIWPERASVQLLEATWPSSPIKH